MLSYPINRIVEVVSPLEKKFKCSLKEEIVNDGISPIPSPVDTFNSYSASGDVIGELVYVNYGRKEDFDLIKNIDLKGKIVIVRYGHIFRGNKVKLAEERGVAAVLIYNDPEDINKDLIYPNGPWASNSTVQRGTIWTGNGDPTTPRYPSLQNDNSIISIIIYNI
jgi:N-acetylated-alpha-linked acidic dipeptidase